MSTACQVVQLVSEVSLVPASVQMDHELDRGDGKYRQQTGVNEPAIFSFRYLRRSLCVHVLRIPKTSAQSGRRTRTGFSTLFLVRSWSVKCPSEWQAAPIAPI